MDTPDSLVERSTESEALSPVDVLELSPVDYDSSSVESESECEALTATFTSALTSAYSSSSSFSFPPSTMEGMSNVQQLPRSIASTP